MSQFTRLTNWRTDRRTEFSSQDRVYIPWSAVKTKLSSNLQDHPQCVYLVKRGHFLSRDKDGGHIIRSAVAINHATRANLTALSSIVPNLLSIKFYIAEIGNYDLFLLQWPWPCSTNFHIWIWPISPEGWRCTRRPKVNLFRQGFRKIYTLCSKKSDAKIQITITAAHLIRINYPLNTFNYRLSSTNVANFNKIHHMVSEQQLFKRMELKNRIFQYGKYWLAYLLQEVLQIMT